MIAKKNLDGHEKMSVLTEIKVSSSVNAWIMQLTHPNIVKLIDVFETDQAYFLVFEIMHGGEVVIVLRQAFRQNM